MKYQGFWKNCIFNHNLFGYCVNNPIGMVDKTGYIAIFDDVLVAAFMGLCVLAVTLLEFFTKAEFQSSWASFCTAAGNGLASIGTTIYNGGKAAYNWTKEKIKAAIEALTLYIALTKAVNKVVSKTKTSRKKEKRFFEISFDKNDIPHLGKQINKSAAIKRLKSGKSVVTYYSTDARSAANQAGGAKSICDQRHGGLGYFNHYHIYGRPNHSHSCFITRG